MKIESATLVVSSAITTFKLLDHTNRYGGVPEVTVATILPFAFPQVLLLMLELTEITCVFTITVGDAFEHPLTDTCAMKLGPKFELTESFGDNPFTIPIQLTEVPPGYPPEYTPVSTTCKKISSPAQIV